MNCYGGRSSVGRAPGCDPGGRGFEPHRSPHLIHCFVISPLQDTSSCSIIHTCLREWRNW